MDDDKEEDKNGVNDMFISAAALQIRQETGNGGRVESYCHLPADGGTEDQKEEKTGWMDGSRNHHSRWTDDRRRSLRVGGCEERNGPR